MAFNFQKLARRTWERMQKRYRKLKKFALSGWNRRQALATYAHYDTEIAPQPLQLARAETGSKTARGFAAIYFSCRRDFGMLELSLASLTRFAGDRICRTYIYEDAADPFAPDEAAALRSAAETVTIVRGPRVTGWGADALVRELTFFRRTYAEIGAAARWIVKLDSDILFLNDSLFAEVEIGDSDLFGNPFAHPCGLTYSQGGCYFIAAGFLPRLCAAPVSDAMRKLSRVMKQPVYHLPEDASVFCLAEGQSARVRFSDFYLPHQRIPSFVPHDAERASVIHFESGLGAHLRPHMARIGRHIAA